MEDTYCLHCEDIIDTDVESTVAIVESPYLEHGTYHESCADGLEDEVAHGVLIDQQVDAMREER